MVWGPAQRYAAEFLGSLALLLFGGGAAVFSLNSTLGFDAEARVVLVSLTFGLVILGMVYIFGEISGGHFNPAVTISMAVSGRMPLRDVVPYLVAQIVGGLIGIGIVAAIAYGSVSGYAAAQGSALASQCYSGMGAPASCGFSLASVFLLELVLTFFFVLVIQMVTRPESPAKNLAPIAIGFMLLITNLVAIPVDGASINPIRSFSPALISAIWPSSQWAIKEAWLFWLAPILGGVLAAVVERLFRRPGPD